METNVSILANGITTFEVTLRHCTTIVGDVFSQIPLRFPDIFLYPGQVKRFLSHVPTITSLEASFGVFYSEILFRLERNRAHATEALHKSRAVTPALGSVLAGAEELNLGQSALPSQQYIADTLIEATPAKKL